MTGPCVQTSGSGGCCGLKVILSPIIAIGPVFVLVPSSALPQQHKAQDKRIAFY